MRLLTLLASVVTACTDSGAQPPPMQAPPALLAAAASGPRAKSSEPLLSWHFLGTGRLAGNTNGSDLREVLAQPSSRDAIQHALGKLSLAPGAWLGVPNATNPSTAARLRPVLDQVLTAETAGDWRVGPGGESAVVVALRVAADKHNAIEAAWSDWIKALGAAAPGETKVGALVAREAKLAHGSVWFRSARAGDWTILGAGRGGALAFGDVAGRVGTLTASEPWLTVKIAGDQVARMLGWSTPDSWPEAEFKVAGHGHVLRTTARLMYAANLDAKLEPWRMPTNTIADPLVSFTVVQGVRSWLARQAWWRDLGSPVTPNQAVAWSRAEIPLASYVAWESSDITNHLRRLERTATAVLSNNVPEIPFGEVLFQPEFCRLTWVGMPVTEPFLSPAAAKDPGYLMAGLFPLLKPKAPLPQALLDQIAGRTNLVYYNWELTHQRMSGWRHIKSLYWRLAGYESPSPQPVGEAWLTDTNVTQRLGNTVTELKRVTPRTLEGVRSSSVGLTGGELVLLMRWLDDPAFPQISKPALSLVGQRRLSTRHTPAATKPATPAPLPPPAPNAPPRRSP